MSVEASGHFPIFPTHRLAVEQTVCALLTSLVMHGVSFKAMSKMVHELHVTRYFRLYEHYLHWEVRQSKAGIANVMEMNVSPRLLLMMLPLTYMHAHTQVLTHTHTRLVVVFVQSFRDFPEFFFTGFGSYIFSLIMKQARRRVPTSSPADDALR